MLSLPFCFNVIFSTFIFYLLLQYILHLNRLLWNKRFFLNIFFKLLFKQLIDGLKQNWQQQNDNQQMTINITT